MALLSFPSSPTNGQLYPTTPIPGQNQYEWEAATQTWRLLGAATGVVPGVYGSASQIPILTVNAQGQTTAAGFADISTVYVKTNNPSAFNGYVWPNSDGFVGTALTTDGTGNLFWGTTITTNIIVGKGALITGTGPNSPVALPVGTNGQYLSACSTCTTGLTWKNLDIATPTTLGVVRVDNSTITVDSAGILTARPRYVYFYDISGLFDGLTAVFTLKVSGAATAPSPLSNILVVLGGVPQSPTTAYTVAGSVITFAAPPKTGTSFMANTIV